MQTVGIDFADQLKLCVFLRGKYVVGIDPIINFPVLLE